MARDDKHRDVIRRDGLRGDGIRRAAGTKTFMDLMRNYEQNRRVARGLPATDPALDLVELAEGRPLAVVARRLVGKRFRRGTLVLHAGAADPIVWFPGFPRRAGQGTPLRPPVEIEPVCGGGTIQFVYVDARFEGEDWRLGIPTIDLDLVLAAVSAANR